MQQITPKLYIGDMYDAITSAETNAIDIIIYLGQEIPLKLCFNCAPTCIHIPLNDGENGLSKIRNTLFTAYMISINERKVLVACRAGISRSVLITTALYALTHKISFDEAYSKIIELRPQSRPELNLLREVKRITEELKCCI